MKYFTLNTRNDATVYRFDKKLEMVYWIDPVYGLESNINYTTEEFNEYTHDGRWQRCTKHGVALEGNK